MRMEKVAVCRYLIEIDISGLLTIFSFFFYYTLIFSLLWAYAGLPGWPMVKQNCEFDT